jgi:membrane protein YdbS with pleckstrin-like domain
VAIPAEHQLREPAERVSPRARLMWTVVALANSVFTYAVLVTVGLVWDVVPVTWWAALLLAVAFLTYTVVMPRLRYAVHRWEVTETAVYTQTGWWSIEQRIAPMSRIQTVDYSEGAIERMFGLASVTVTTASAAGALEISGLDRELARRLAEELTVQADAVPGDAT